MRQMLRGSRPPALPHGWLRSFFLAAPSGLGILDAGLCFLRVNEALARITGRPRRAHRGCRMRDLMPGIAAALEPVLQRVLDARTPVDVEVTEQVSPRAHRQWSVCSFPLRGRSGKAGVGLTMVEITERKHAEERLVRSLLDERRFRALVEHSSDAIALLGADRSVLYASPSTARVLGYQAEEFAAHDELEIVHPGDRERLQALFATLVREPGSRITAEARIRHRDGSWRWVEAVAVNLLEEPSVGAVAVNYRDITERKRTEDALREANGKLTFWARELERHNRELSLIRELGELLQACHSLEEAYRAIARSARDLFPECPGAMYMVSQARNLVEAVATWGPGPLGDEIFGRDDCWALRRGRVHMSEDSELLCRHLGDPAPPASVCVPMVGQGETLGVLHLRFDTQDAGLVQAYRQLASSVAERIVLALDNLKLRETLRSQSIRDPLTGLYNRRYLEESLERELRRAERLAQPLAVVVFDLDHFKHINDMFGHETGDVVLATFADFLQSRIRKEDIACRYGGEEFMLILPGASLEDAAARAHQLSEASRHLSLSHRGRGLGTVTLSLGVAVFPDHGSTAGDLLRAADQALYRAKQQGRDRVEIAAVDRAGFAC